MIETQPNRRSFLPPADELGQIPTEANASKDRVS